MARSRQQLLASMVLLGINRIVVTDGAINAKVVFDLKANDEAKREARASLYDTQMSANRNTTVAGVRLGLGRRGIEQRQRADARDDRGVGGRRKLGVEGGGEGEADGRGARELQERLPADGEDGHARHDRVDPGQRDAVRPEHAGGAACRRARPPPSAHDGGAMAEPRHDGGRNTVRAVAGDRRARSRCCARTRRSTQPRWRWPATSTCPTSASAPTAVRRRHARAAPPLYLAHQLEAAGLLRTGELMAGLFAAGSINAPLDAKLGNALHEFWRGRNERLNEQERAHLFAQVFDAATFEPQMRRLCEALVALADNSRRSGTCARTRPGTRGAHAWPKGCRRRSRAWSRSPRTTSSRRSTRRCASCASAACRWPSACSDLWAMVATTNRAQGVSAQAARDQVDRGTQAARSCCAGWSTTCRAARAWNSPIRRRQSVIAAAQRWLLAIPAVTTARPA